MVYGVLCEKITSDKVLGVKRPYVGGIGPSEACSQEMLRSSYPNLVANVHIFMRTTGVT
jgi:hypothetical protein